MNENEYGISLRMFNKIKKYFYLNIGLTANS